ncbi:Heat shock 70 kDa protein BIP2 [Linum grandiflorum]
MKGGGEPVIGIDLGTTYSCVAVARDGIIEIITNDQGNRTTPSIVSFSEDGRLIGEAAKNQATLNPTRTFFDVKRLIGAVVTVPAYFNDAQRQATKDAGRIAGLEVERIINEPTAGAIAYEWRRDWEGGDTHLGGGDFDQRVMKYFIDVLTRARFEELNLDLFKKTKGDVDEIVLVGGSTRIPRLREMLKDMFDGKEPCKGVNPDEAVAYGAAVLAANLSGALAAVLYDVTLCDVTPLSLGVHVEGDLMSVIIPRNTPIPTKMSRGYETVDDWPTSVSIRVYQGERPFTKDCIELGRFCLSGLTPAPRGVTKIYKTLEIDENGILTVSAREEGGSATSASLTITSYKGDLTKTEIERMIEKAKTMAKKDEIAKARVDARNRLERFIYDLKNGDNKMERELEEASGWLDGNQDASKEDYEKKMKELKHICY